MSLEGGQEIEKHGGAHEERREYPAKSEFLLTDPFPTKNGYPETNESIREIRKIQDGATKFNDNGKNESLAENLQFLAEDMDSYERAVVENNAEWLKSRCSNIDALAFNIPNHPNDVSLPLELGGEGKKLSESVVGDLITMDTDVSGIPLCSDSGVLSQEGVHLLRQNSIANVSIPESATVSLDCTPSVTLEPPLLSTGSELNLDREIFISDSKELEFQSIISDKSNTLMTPQELESMPEDGMEFEESVGPKSNVRIAIKDGVLSVLSDGKEDFDTCTILDGLKVDQECFGESSSLLNGQMSADDQNNTLYLSLPGAENNVSAVQVGSSVTGNPLLQQGNLTLATISISTDKAANSTQILVDTNQGQQFYQINTADLTLASNALKPLSQTDGNVEAKEVANTDPEAASLLPSSATTSPVKPLTGYLLLPVTRQDSTNNGVANHNVLMSVPNQVSGTQEIQDLNVNNVQPNDLQLKAGEKSKKLFLCPHPGCGRMFKKISKLTVHHMRHTGERPYKCPKEGCDWAFTTLYKLKRHEESHQGRKDFQCNYCSKNFSTVYNLNSHMKLHERPCLEECPLPDCRERFATKRQLDIHMKNHAGIEKTYKCPVEGCDKVFYSSNCMGSHPRVHQQDAKELTCDFEGCGRVFDKVCRLKQHKRCHTGEKPYVCHYSGCGWAFTTASKLKRHMGKHTGLRKWLCYICGKAFMRAEHLKGHIITHSKMKPFTCPFNGCTAKFTAKSSLYVHLKKHDHSGEDIVYHCPMEGCEKKYSNKASLRAHILKHFPNCITPEDAAQIDIMPSLSDDLDSSGMEGSSAGESQNDAAEQGEKAVQGGEVVTETNAAQQGLGIDPTEFITTIVEDQLPEINVRITNPGSSVGTQDLVTKVTSHKSQESGVAATSTQVKVSNRKDTAETSTGSARTDYHSNLIQKGRARKLRKLQNKSSENGSLDISSEDSTSETQGVLVMPATSEFSSVEALSSHGITFRDPETGVLYVQTQLLQDDPPHPDLYSDEAVLCSDLSLPDTSDSEIVDHSMGAVTEFVGSTINLQDLV